MVTQFEEFNFKIKFITRSDSDKDVAKALGIIPSTYYTMKKSNHIPYDVVIEYCQERQISLDWIFSIQDGSKL